VTHRYLIGAVVSALAACSAEPSSSSPAAGGNQGGSSEVGNNPGALAGGAAGASMNGAGAAGSSTSSTADDAAEPGGVGGTGDAGSSGGPFPNGAVAAVSLTYDDGLDPHLTVVGPVLDAHGLKGTFFLSNFEGVDHQWALPNLKDPLTPRHLAWQAMGQNGHELAGHTVNHPCNSATKAAGYHLTDYDMTRMSNELDDDLARMKRLGATSPFTFAYPCYSDTMGIGPSGQNFSALIPPRFDAARGSAIKIADPKSVDLYHVSLLDALGQTGDQLRAMVDQAIVQKGWLVILFHGIGVETTCPNLDYKPSVCMINYLVTSADAHAKLVAYLDEKKSEVWTAPFRDVAERLKSMR
jgi:sialate O-acetylesterase